MCLVLPFLMSKSTSDPNCQSDIVFSKWPLVPTSNERSDAFKNNNVFQPSMFTIQKNFLTRLTNLYKNVLRIQNLNLLL